MIISEEYFFSKTKTRSTFVSESEHIFIDLMFFFATSFEETLSRAVE